MSAPTPADRARELLARTELFDEFGFGQLAAGARMVARDVLDLCDALEGERSARRAVQERAERLEQILLTRGGGRVS